MHIYHIRQYCPIGYLLRPRWQLDTSDSGIRIVCDDERVVTGGTSNSTTVAEFLSNMGLQFKNANMILML